MNRKKNSNGKFGVQYEIESELLKSLYLGNQYNAHEIAKIFGCSAGAIYTKLKNYDIPCIHNSSWYKNKYEIESELLWALYWGEELSTKKIGNLFGCSSSNIGLRMEKYDIPKRDMFSNHTKIKILKKELEDLYIDKNMTIASIAEIYNCSSERIGHFLKIYEIKIKERNEYKIWNVGTKGLMKPNSTSFKKGFIPWNKGKIILHDLICKQCGIPFKHKNKKKLFCSIKCRSESQSGENSVWWKGGVTTENNKLRRGRKFKKWRESVFERDNWTCQHCNVRGGKLHPHHIKPWAKYPESRFDISNGITLCIKCHSNIHHRKI